MKKIKATRAVCGSTIWSGWANTNNFVFLTTFKFMEQTPQNRHGKLTQSLDLHAFSQKIVSKIQMLSYLPYHRPICSMKTM